MIQRNMLVVHRRWFSLRPWRLASWLGVAYECGQVARAVVRRQGGVAVRAKWDAMRMSLGAPRAAADSGRLRPWLGVRSRAVPR